MDTVTRRNAARPSATLNPTFAPMSLSSSPRPTSVAATDTCGGSYSTRTLGSSDARAAKGREHR